MIELDIRLLLLFSLGIDSKFNVLLELEPLLLLVNLEELIEDRKLNLLFFRKSMNSPFNEICDNLGVRNESLDEHEATLVASLFYY